MEGERRSKPWSGVRIGLTGRILILVNSKHLPRPTARPPGDTGDRTWAFPGRLIYRDARTREEAALAVQSLGQIASGLSRPYEGLGLGLIIVSKLSERRGGRLTIAGALHKVRKISLDFPVPTARAEARSWRRTFF
jgi:hypothetical protein